MEAKSKAITVRLPLEAYREIQRRMAARLNAGQEAKAGAVCRELILTQLAASISDAR